MEAEPDRSTPPRLPQPVGDDPWQDRLLLWRERTADLLQGSPAKLASVVGVLGVALAAFLWVGSSRQGPPVETLLPVVDPEEVRLASPTPIEQPPTTIVVHVAGAVLRPGLVNLTPPARVADAVDAAGGASNQADLDRLNLATLLSDGDRVVVPVEGEPVPELASQGLGPSAAAPGPLDLNQATADQLEELPGVGPATAAAIIAYRTENGPFSSVTALDNVAGIGPAKLAQLRDLVSVGP